MSAEPTKPRPDGRPRVLILAPHERPSVVAEAVELRSFVEQHADVVGFDVLFEMNLEEVEADLAVVIGGDGSILRASRQMGRHQVPIIGVNRGRLGFLADLLPEQFRKVWPAVCAGEYTVVEHLMFEASVLRDGELIERRLGLNETAVRGGTPFQILEINLVIDGEPVTTYSGDGLILSTPVGSTAHNLSAGGPILRQNIQAFVICPISPHTLTNRPVVDDASRVYELSVTRPTESTSVVVDGRVLCRLRKDDLVRVVRAEPTFKLVEVAGRSYYRTLREKLGWGGELPWNQTGPDEGPAL
jgi:NAD+ kinase